MLTEEELDEIDAKLEILLRQLSDLHRIPGFL
jgi:hypothetical protein